MQTLDIFFAIAALLLLSLNVVATYIVVKTEFIVKARKYYQLLFIWAVPILGGVLAIVLNREDYSNRGRNSDPSGGPHSTYGETNEYMGANHRGGR